MTPAAPAQERVIAVWDAIDASFDGYLDELEELCRFRSRREEPDGMLATKEWIERRLRALGASIEVVESACAYPYLLARVGTGERSLLNFNHYDVEVEPPGPDEAWTTPPYEPARRDGRMFARGIADDKAALLSRIHVVDAFVKAGVELPVEVRFLIEGKRTLGAPALAEVVDCFPDFVRADGALWENSWSDFDGRPLLKLGEKGILYLELRCRALDRDLSSQNAILLPQAAARVTAAVAALTRSTDGRHVPGFLESVTPWGEIDAATLAAMPFDREYLIGRAGESLRESLTAVDAPAYTVRTSPTIVLSWIHAGPPAGSVALGVPAECSAGIEVRLVPGQTTDGVLAAFRSFLAGEGLDTGLEIEVRRAGEPESTDSSGWFAGVVATAAELAHGVPPVLEATTVWIGTRALVAAAGVPVVGVGIARPDSGVDGPDENILIEDYRLALRHLAAIIVGMAT